MLVPHRKGSGIIPTGYKLDELPIYFPIQKYGSDHINPIRTILTSFVISDDALNPSECTEAIGIQPTESYAKGDIIFENKPPRPTGEWIINTGWIEIDDTNYGIDLVMDIIWPKRDLIRKFIEKKGLSSAIVTAVEIYNNYPAYWVSKQNIYRMSYLNCEYSWNIYDFTPND